MAGMIQENMAPPAAPEQAVANTEAPARAPEQAAAGTDAPPTMDKITPESITAQMHLSAKQKPQLERIVAAGMKVMFDPKTHDMMLEQIDAEGPIDQKLGQSIAGLLGLLMKESNNSLPPDMLIPAGIVLLVHAADFLEKSGEPVSDEEVAAGISVLVRSLLKQFGMDPDKVAEVGGRALNPTEEAAPPPDAPAAPPAGGGVVQGAM